jgi:Holliday junction DNA helicase RuvA
VDVLLLIKSMLSYLKGTVADIYKTTNRSILVLDVNQVGYELQIPARMEQQISTGSAEIVQVFTHQQVREDQLLLYGFASAAERDLFRQLISVSGVGAQLAIALLDTLGLPDLVQAIVTSNVRALSKTPGVGNKTAERLALELKTKLSEWRSFAGVAHIDTTESAPAIQEEVEMTLHALGYSPSEVIKALQAVRKDGLIAKSPNPEDWIRKAITWLTQHS